MKKNPVVLVVMDGIGLSDELEGNAVKQAYTPNLDYLFENAAYTTLQAHGTMVGLPTDSDMGNSEVGHNALGSGQIYSQGAKLVNESIETGAMFESETWKWLVDDLNEHTLHLIGLLSDGNVHSHIDHVKAMVQRAKADGVKKLALHALQDGRDVDGQSALIYIDEMQALFDELNDDTFHATFASGGGRMHITMDRYNADWPMVERGWHTHVLGEGEKFESARAAIEHFRKEDPSISDQYIPSWVIEKDGEPVAPIVDGDAVIFFNFRGDRALELSQAFEAAEGEFDHFDRIRVPQVKYAGMLQYDGDAAIPKHFLVHPPKIENTLGERLVEENLKTFAISETQKYGHVTYFWNGNRLEKFSEELEVFKEVQGDDVTFDQRPWMKSAEITDEVIKALESGEFDFIRLNYPNGDMVGHTGDFLATKISVEATDLAIGRLLPYIKKHNATLIVLADHGNAEEMIDKKNGKVKTSHTLNPVPFIIYNRDVKLKEGHFGLANVAATVCDLLDVDAHKSWEESLIDKK